MIREMGTAHASSRSSGSSSGRKVQSVVLKQYFSLLYDRVHSYWILPEMRKWDRNLETIVVLTIRRDGSIADMQIERRSRDQFFDQFVMKTLESAAPMPRFPTMMSQATIEVGLRFKPGELAM
jgi:colicin import membrane protein